MDHSSQRARCRRRAHRHVCTVWPYIPVLEHSCAQTQAAPAGVKAGTRTRRAGSSRSPRTVTRETPCGCHGDGGDCAAVRDARESKNIYLFSISSAVQNEPDRSIDLLLSFKGTHWQVRVSSRAAHTNIYHQTSKLHF